MGDQLLSETSSVAQRNARLDCGVVDGEGRWKCSPHGTGNLRKQSNCVFGIGTDMVSVVQVKQFL
jgi:hypothetical protein